MIHRSLVRVLLVGAIVVACVSYAPTNLGGHTTYVTTHGTSMAPRFHAGDLAVVQPARTYRVGDVVAYRSRTLGGATVLHRIVAIHSGRYSFKGDNNDFVDPDQPTAPDLVGRLRARIPHGGAIRAWLARPIVLFPLLALAIGGAGAGLYRSKSRRHARRGARRLRPAPSLRSAGSDSTAPVPHPGRNRLAVVVPIAGAVVAAGCALATVAIGNLPRTETATRIDSYRQHLTTGYSGTAPAGAAYPDGTFETGDPLFTRLVPRVRIGFDYALTGADRLERARGTYAVIATITGAAGWHRSFTVAAAHPFSGRHIHAEAVLDLTKLKQLEARLATETGLPSALATVAVAPRVKIAGVIDGTPFASDITSTLDFQLTAVAMVPTRRNTADSATDANTVTKAGSLTATITRPRQVTVWNAQLAPGEARVALIVAFALAFAAAAATLTIGRRRAARGEIHTIVRRYGKLLIETRCAPPVAGRAMVHVDSMDSLARLARLHEQLIIHSIPSGPSTPPGEPTHRFVLFTETGVYGYTTAATSPGPGFAAPTAADTDPLVSLATETESALRTHVTRQHR